MRIYGNNGVFDRVDGGRVWVQNLDTWDNLPSTWDEWTRYVRNPDPTLYVKCPTLDLGSVQTFNILTNVEARGIINYYIHYSSTDEVFVNNSGNYQSLYIPAGSTAIPSITARWVMVQLAIDYDPALGHQYFDSISNIISQKGKTLTFANINSATLPGTVGSRTFSIGEDVGGIKNVQITSQGATAYNVDLYVSKNPTSTKTFPQVLSKTTSGVGVAFIGIDGELRDSVFDITVEVLPEWYINDFGNLVER